MAKSRKNSKSVLSSISKTSQKALPAINTGLKNVGTAAVKSIPIVEKGVSVVYGTMATGFDLGVKGVAKGVKVAKSFKKSRSSKRHTRKTRRH